jgi:hypothetical protein
VKGANPSKILFSAAYPLCTKTQVRCNLVHCLPSLNSAQTVTGASLAESTIRLLCLRAGTASSSRRRKPFWGTLRQAVVPAMPIFDGSTAVATTFPPSLVMANLEKFSRATSLTRLSPPATPARRSAPLSDQPPSRREPSADDDLASLDNLTVLDPFTAVDERGQQTMAEDRGNYRLFSPPNVGTGRVA